MLLNISTLSAAITGALFLSGRMVHGSAIPTTEIGSPLSARQSRVEACLEGGSTVTASVQELVEFGEEISSSVSLGISSPPLIPNCFDLDLGPEAECLQCQNVATITYGVAVLECTTASFGCGIFEPACLAGCIAAATFTLYGADQACYCLHADCSEASVRSSIPQPPLPEIIGGGRFTVPGGVIVPGSSTTFFSEGEPAQCSSQII
ncbi:hypothetical protein B0O99DRAFT_691846 [Bisporella sp. PMI_857]|nr:hypothetical protein B0O99DRAFT_691846 [Bisporella sp. PMI_857]